MSSFNPSLWLAVITTACMTSAAAWAQPFEPPAFGPGAALHSHFNSDSGNDNDPSLATDAAGVWVTVWSSEDTLGGTLGGDYDILFSRSVDNGSTWSAPAALHSHFAGDGSENDAAPKLATDAAGTWVVVWESDNPSSDLDILYSRSTDNGLTWSPPVALTSNSQDDQTPVVVAAGAGNWIAVWRHDPWLPSFEYGDIHYSRSTDGAFSWATSDVLHSHFATDSGRDWEPEIECDGAGTCVVIWSSDDDLGGTIGSDWDILRSRSADYGLTWSAPDSVNNHHAGVPSDLGNDNRPDLATNGAGQWIAVWHSYINPYENSVILRALSSDDGVTWDDTEVLEPFSQPEDDSHVDPAIATDRLGNWVVAWDSSTTSSPLFSLTGDDGLNFGNAENLTGGRGVPAIMTDGAGRWVMVFRAYDGGVEAGYDIFFSTGLGPVGLDLQKYDSRDPVSVGSQFDYELTVENTRGTTAHNVSLTDTLPPDVSLLAVTPDQGSCTSANPVVCNLGDIALGATVGVTITVSADAVGTSWNYADVTADEGDDSTNHSTTVQACPTGNPCDDGNLCTESDTCDGLGLCGGTPIVCDDANECTIDSCDASSGCVTTPDDGAPCDDGVFCNGPDTCAASACASHAGDPCIGPDGDGDCSESCDEFAGNCLGSDPELSSCDDTSVCSSNDHCIGGACTGNMLDCDDVDDCTADGCDAVTGCFNTPVGGCTSPVVVPAAGDLLVSDTSRDAVLRVHELTGDRTVVTSPAAGGGATLVAPTDLAVTDAGDIYVREGPSSVVHVDPTTGLRTLVSGAGAGSGPAFSNLWSLDSTSDGTVLVVDEPYAAPRVIAVDPAAGARTIVSGCEDAGCTAVRGSGHEWGWGVVAAEPGGSILVGELPILFPGNLIQIDPETGDRVIASGPGEFGSGVAVGSGALWVEITDIAAGPGRVAWVVDYYSAAIYRVDLATGDRTVVSGPGVGTGPSLADATDLARAADGTLFVANGIEQVLAVDPTTGDRWVVSDASLGTGTTFLWLQGIALVPEPDTDGDGLRDVEETLFFDTDPADSDSDDDGLSDGEEVNRYGTDPNDVDSDDDSHRDSTEVQYGSDPTDPRSRLWQVDLTLTLENLAISPPIVTTAVGVARVETDPTGTHLSGFGVLNGLLSTQVTLMGPTSAPTIFATVGNGVASFTEATTGSFGGVMPVTGLYRLCLLAGCSVTAEVPLTENGTRGIGIGGSPIVASAAGVTLTGAPWTTGVTSVATGSGATFFRTGFIHGPASGSSLSSVLSGAGTGVVQMVTASVTTSSTAGVIPGFGTLEIRFVPEPGSLAGLLAGAGLLSALGLRHARRNRRRTR